MKNEKNRYTEEQIDYALKQAELGTAVPEICRKPYMFIKASVGALGGLLTPYNSDIVRLQFPALGLLIRPYVLHVSHNVPYIGAQCLVTLCIRRHVFLSALDQR